MCPMFLQDQTTRITADAVLDALANPHDREILALAQDEPVTAQGVIQRTGIPKSTVYRRIERLTERGLLQASDGRLHNGHVVDRYRASIQQLSLSVSDGQVHADWEPIEPQHASQYEVQYATEQPTTGPTEHLVAPAMDA